MRELEGRRRWSAHACGRRRDSQGTAIEYTIDFRLFKIGAEEPAGREAIAIDLLFQRVDACERSFRALERNELDQQSLSVNVTGKVQEVDFNTRGAVVELRPRSIAGDAIRDFAVQENAHGIDPETKTNIVDRP